MFEDSTFESAHRIHTRSRTWGVVAFTFNGLILAALVAIPLIYPEALPKQMMSMLISAPPLPASAPKPVVQQPAASHFQGRTEFPDMRLTVPIRIPTTRQIPGPEHAPGNSDMISLGPNTGIPSGDPFGTASSSHPAVVQGPPKGPTVISRGVAEGMLLQKVTPRYPPIAQASHTQGTVVLQAVISKNGMIENLRVLSGSPMLTQAALDAVSQWRYRPYLLNGEPVAVETTINVVFRLSQ
jgi:periplasmic protein TonB